MWFSFRLAALEGAPCAPHAYLNTLGRKNRLPHRQKLAGISDVMGADDPGAVLYRGQQSGQGSDIPLRASRFAGKVADEGLAGWSNQQRAAQLQEDL